MAAPRKVQARSIASREAIVRGAAQAFNDHGYSAATIAEVAEHAGMSEGAIYHHFSSKADLAVAVMEALYETWERHSAQVLVDAAARDLGGLATLSLSVERMAEHYRQDVIVQAATRLGNERDLIPATLPTPFVGWFPFIDGQLRRAQDEGTVSERVDREAFCRVLTGSFLGVQEASRRTSDRADLAQRIDEWWRLLVAGLTAGS